MKFLRNSLIQLLDYILASMTEAEAIQFLTIFKDKLQETFEEMKDILNV